MSTVRISSYFSTLKNKHTLKKGPTTAVPPAALLLLLRKGAMWHHSLKPVWPGGRAWEHFTHTLVTYLFPTRGSSASHKSFLEDTRHVP